MTLPRVQAQINLSALQHNFLVLRQKLSQKTRFLAMVKANAYGHRSALVSPVLQEYVDGFGVATIDEALELRTLGVTLPIIVLCGPRTADELATFIHHQLTAVIHQQEQLNWLESYQGNGSISVWIKLDSGMHRLGFLPEEIIAAYERCKAAAIVADDMVLMTHLADADCADSSLTQRQLACFDRIFQTLPIPRSVCNSAGILSMDTAHFDWVRPGIALYGVSPFLSQSGESLGLRPVMTLLSELMAVKICPAGDVVGYNGTYQCAERMPIGIVSMGYGDGYPRHIAAETPVLIYGKLCPIIGRVSMDMLAVDLRPLDQLPAIGTSVTLWGDGLPIEHIARSAGTTAYELFCQLTDRVQFFPV